MRMSSADARRASLLLAVCLLLIGFQIWPALADDSPPAFPSCPRGGADCVGGVVGVESRITIHESRSVRLRVSVATEVVHGQGYWSPGLRLGHDGGWGLRAGALVAPVWAGAVPDHIRQAKPQFDLESHGYIGVDREFCATRWCAGLGIVRINGLSYMNGTRYNFGLYARYLIDRHWSLDYIHFSHGSALGIADDKSNRGWNLLGIGYSF